MIVVDPMKWIEDIKELAAAFKDWARLLAVLGCVVAGLLVVIAIELLVICFKI